MFFAYFAPEVAFPLTSAIAAAAGFIMLVGRAPIRLAARGMRPMARAVKAPFRFAARGFQGVGRGMKAVVDKLDL